MWLLIQAGIKVNLCEYNNGLSSSLIHMIIDCKHVVAQVNANGYSLFKDDDLINRTPNGHIQL